MPISHMLLQSILAGLQTSTAQVNAQECITRYDPTFKDWMLAGDDFSNEPNLFHVVPELVGLEESLKAVRQHAQPLLQLDHINRPLSDGKIKYFNFTLIAGQPEGEGNLLLLVTDITRQGQYLQELTQNRNELSLMRRRMAKLSYQLDTLVRHYLSPEVADAFLRGDLDLELGGELREVTILFADARDFSSFSEQFSPDQVVHILNNHLEIVSQAITDFDGTITQFQGDNIIAIFNIFGDQPQHATQAVQAAIAIQQSLQQFQSEISGAGPQLKFGVGINTGSALIGNIGASRRYSYTASGDAVNLASRITAATPAGDVWLSQATRLQLMDDQAIEALPAVQFKGRSQSTHLFKVVFDS